MLAYLFRFDSKKGYFFYPEATDKCDEVLWLNRGSTYEKNVEARDDIYLVKHGLKIPDAVVDYEEFVTAIHENEEIFMTPFIKSYGEVMKYEENR